MEPKPVKRSSAPRYPTRLEVMGNRELLEKHMPATWKSCVEMAAAATLFVTVGSCRFGIHQAIVAPIFEHGEGRAVAGCEVVNPPVFLSEQDAMQVVDEELAKSGLVLSDRKVKFPEISIPQRKEGESAWTAIIAAKPLVLPGFDPVKNVGVAVVGYEGYFDVGGAKSSSSVQEFDFKQVAEELRWSVAADGHRFYLGTFYDPGVSQEESDFAEEIRRYEDLYRTADPKLKGLLIASLAESISPSAMLDRPSWTPCCASSDCC